MSNAYRRILRNFFLIGLAFAVSSGCKRDEPATTHTQTPDYATPIRAALNQDRSAGEKFREAAKTDKLAAVRDYLQALRQIDLRACPVDFQEAFLKHRYAWEELLPFMEKYDGYTGDLVAFFELGSAIINNQSTTTEGDREVARIRKAISASYFEVEKIALRYGVQAQH
ncbi:MAG: hypothetical protein C0467_32850 [Planctomycetaceae bacterium]|nr:hypothetical protein [Planctomycetaceae bacterium]